MNVQKVAVIGWDSASFEIVEPLLQAGTLPNLQRLMARARWGRLASTLHPLSPTAWASFMTGMNPGKHGIFDFVGLAPEGYFRFANGGAVGAETLWARLSRAGRRVCVINVPMTFPPQSVNGALVAGMDTPRQSHAFTHPPELRQEITDRFGRYRVDARARGRMGASVEQFTPRYVRELVDVVRKRGEVTCYLLERTRPDFLMAVFTAPDRVQHALGHLMAGQISPQDGIGRVYQACDRALGAILDKLDDSWAVLLMSDHGACAYQRVFELATWLAQEGWLQVRPSRSPTPLDDYLGPIRRGLARLFLPPDKRMPGRERFLNRIVWDQTRAIPVGAFGSIYINLRGRFPNGIVEPGDEYDALCEQLCGALLAVRDPETGESIVRAVHRAAEIYRGPFVDRAPDLLIETEHTYFVRSNLDHLEGRVTYQAGRYGGRSLAHTGRHTANGILIAAGDPFVPGQHSGGAQIIDLAPTVLHLTGLPVPADMDGRPLVDWLDPDYCRQRPVQWQDRHDAVLVQEDAVYSQEDEAAVEARLRDLGYLG